MPIAGMFQNGVETTNFSVNRDKTKEFLMAATSVESVTASLVREYLSRKGLKTTLRVMDEECPREDDSISNRQQLMKELHIDKLMKKNKETSKPLKAMLEVIAQYMMMNQVKDRVTKNGDVDNDSQRPSSVRSNLRSAASTASTKSQYPTKEDTQMHFDGFPASQQDDDDDLLKPDPNFVYPQQKKAPKHNPVTVTRKVEKKAHTNDLVIEDSHEGETVLGGGRAGMIEADGEEEDQMPTRSVASQRPRSTAKPRALAMAGPITSTEDNSRRKFNKPRPLSATKNQRLNLFDNNNYTPKFSSLDSSNDTKPSPKPTLINSKPIANSDSNQTNMREIDSLVSQGRKKSIEDILEIEQNKPAPALRRQSSAEKEKKHYSVDNSSIAKEKKPAKSKSQPQGSSGSTVKVGDLEMGDVDDLDQDLSKLSVGPRAMSAKINKAMHNSKPIDVKTAVALKTLIFGSPMQSFNDEWKFQSFSFCDLPKLKYGIVQKKGGACGVLASVQATVLQELLFGEKKIPPGRFNEPTCEERTESLALALAKIFWRAGEKRKAVVCIPSSRPVIGSGGKFRADEFIETLSLYTFVDVDELTTFMKQTVNQFELDGLGGVVLSLYSVILSRKIDSVKDDMDQPSNTLMGAHGYCTQEMVNLYVSGRAISNVFNDVIELDSGDGNVMILKGIVSRCDVGLLSLFEHYKSCQVGTYLKTPRYPVWVVCSESHFSVLFCTRRELTSDWKAERRFDLYYYDGLARQQEEIKLSIATNSRVTLEPPPSEDELIPPLELCIRTKWEGAEVDWNGTEPLL